MYSELVRNDIGFPHIFFCEKQKNPENRSVSLVIYEEKHFNKRQFG
jgi:hypothetical protein